MIVWLGKFYAEQRYKEGHTALGYEQHQERHRLEDLLRYPEEVGIAPGLRFELAQAVILHRNNDYCSRAVCTTAR